MREQKKIPRFKTDEEMAAFWDTHDFTNYIEDTKPADDVRFVSPKKGTVSIRIEEDRVKELKRLAHKVGLGYTSLIRSWIIEKLARIHSLHPRKA